jgi:ATP-dependent DNA helicase RecQ
MREWRRSISRELSIPAFIVMHDTTLDELCKVQPSTLAQLRKVSGFGDRKVEMYGPKILEALKNFGSKPRRIGAA